MYQVLLTHYSFSMSSGHAAPTRIADYVAVPEEAAGLLDHAECHSRRSLVSYACAYSSWPHGCVVGLVRRNTLAKKAARARHLAIFGGKRGKLIHHGCGKLMQCTSFLWISDVTPLTCVESVENLSTIVVDN